MRAVLGAASLTIELARLQVELRRQLAEVEVSAPVSLHAGDEERRRLERDLHDGAQQRLVGLGIRLRRLQRSLPGSARVLVPVLDEAVDEVARAIADLRTIAAGLRPSGSTTASPPRSASWPARPRSPSTSPRRASACRSRSRPPPTSWPARR